MNQYDNLPDELRETGKFNCWRFQERPDGGKPGKVPYNVLIGGRGQSNNPDTFTDYQTALAAVSDYDGLGIGVFDDLAIIDFDDCVNNGTISVSEAQDVIEMLGAYTEISPSGTGIRIICKASGFLYDTDAYYIHNKSLGLEIYIAGATNKFLTVTGNVIHGGNLENHGDQIQSVLEKYMQRPTPLDMVHAEAHSFLTDDEVIEKAMAAKNGEKFSKLWTGVISDYASQSDADMALAGMLTFWCGRDHEQIERLLGESALGQRDKWNREDYRDRTICAAIRGCHDVYTPDYGKSCAAEDFVGYTESDFWIPHKDRKSCMDWK
jgi:putative DNA primase/helicase